MSIWVGFILLFVKMLALYQLWSPRRFIYPADMPDMGVETEVPLTVFTLMLGRSN